MGKLKFSITGLFFIATFLISYAHDFKVNGIYYNKNADGTSVAVTYRGNSYNEYSGEYSGNVVIPSSVTYSGNTYSVTSIGNSAFKGCDGLTSITIPNSVTSIGDYAFHWCDGLTSITIPNSVTSIGNSAFSGCSGLASVTIGNSVTSIGDSAFYWCDGLTSITIPNSVTSIGNYAFFHCSGLTSVTLGNSVASIGNSAFWSCDGLTSITIPNSVTSIGERAFQACDGLTSITIPNSVTSIGNKAFSGCSGMTTISVESGNTVYDSRNNCNAIVESATNTLMCGCKNTVIPNSVTSIANDAFSCCSGLTSITIPNSVTSIGYSAFYYCDGLNLLRCDAVTPPSLGYDVFYKVNKSTCKLLVPDQSISQYKAAEQWKDFLNISDAEMVTVDESGISVENGAIVNRSNMQIDVYSISGAKAYSGNDAEITLPSGIYVVKAGEKVVKVAL